MIRSQSLLLAAMVLCGTLIGPVSPSTPADAGRTTQGVDSVAANIQQAARLRKLHLVRPDLINYPIAFDVIC